MCAVNCYRIFTSNTKTVSHKNVLEDYSNCTKNIFNLHYLKKTQVGVDYTSVRVSKTPSKIELLDRSLEIKEVHHHSPICW